MTGTGGRGPRTWSGEGFGGFTRGLRGAGGLQQELGSANRFSGGERTSRLAISRMGLGGAVRLCSRVWTVVLRWTLGLGRVSEVVGGSRPWS